MVRRQEVAQRVDRAVDEVGLLLEREARTRGHGAPGRVAEGLALALALRVEGEHLVAGPGQCPGRPPVHVLRALDRPRRDDDAGVRALPAVGPDAADELRTGAGQEGHGPRGHRGVREGVPDRTAGQQLAEGGVDPPLGQVGDLAAEVRQERLRRVRRERVAVLERGGLGELAGPRGTSGSCCRGRGAGRRRCRSRPPLGPRRLPRRGRRRRGRRSRRFGPRRGTAGASHLAPAASCPLASTGPPRLDRDDRLPRRRRPG